MNTFTTIFLLICAFCLGIALGGYIASFRQNKKPEDRAAESQPGDLIRMRKDADSGSMEVIVAGKSFHSAAEMNQVQRTLTGYVVNDLRTWLSPQASSEQASSDQPPLDAAPAETTPDAVAGDVPPVATVSATVVETLAALSPGVPAGLEPGVDEENKAAEVLKKRKRGGFMGMITRALGSDVPSSRIVTKSIAVQVNEILQKKLKDTPLGTRGICLMELPGQEMVVMIGLDKYESVNAVPEEEIRAVLQSAVNEWLARSS